MKISVYSKAVSGGFLAAGAAIAGLLQDGDLSVGDWLILIGAFIGGAVGVAVTKNTEVIPPSPGNEPVKIKDVVSNTGEKVGEVVEVTGDMAGGVVAGTTGVLGGVLDATVGKVIPGGSS